LSLSKKECGRLIEILNSYNEDKSVGRLVKSLINLLQPVEYLPLLKDIRRRIYKNHVLLFDTLINTYLYRSFSSAVGPNDHRKAYSVATLPKNGLHSTVKRALPCRFLLVQFHQPLERFVDVGIFFCDKLESLSGIKVGAVGHNSPAAGKGVRLGDYVIEVNGRSLEKVSLKTALRILPSLKSIHLVIRRHKKVSKITLTSFNPW